MPVDRRSPNQAVVSLIHHEVGVEFPGHCIQPPKTGVMTGEFVFGPWVAQADKEFDHVEIIVPSAQIKMAHQSEPFCLSGG